MRIRSRRLSPLVLLLSGCAGSQGGLLSINPGLMVWTVITFLVLLAILARAAYPRLLGAVEAREEHIRELLAAAARDRASAQQAMERQAQELQQVRERVLDMIASERAEAERERDEILAQARRESEETVAAARRDILREVADTFEAFRRDAAADIAITAASRLLGRSLDDPESRRLVREVMDESSTRPGSRRDREELSAPVTTAPFRR